MFQYSKHNLMKLSKKEQLAYLAGVLDSDGCFSVGKYHRSDNKSKSLRLRYESRIRVVNTNKNLCFSLQNMFGGRVTRSSPEEGNHKAAYEWVLDGNGINNILESVIPYLTIKKVRAKIFLKYRRTFSKYHKNNISVNVLKKRDFYYNEMKKSNFRGVIATGADRSLL